MDELEKRVQQFNSHSLPGQPFASHMGTVYLVNDLWGEVQKLRATQQGEQADDDHCDCGRKLRITKLCPVCDNDE